MIKKLSQEKSQNLSHNAFSSEFLIYLVLKELMKSD